MAIVADVSTAAGNRELIDAAEAAFGQVDLFFANAGVAVGTDLTTTEADWQLAFDVNVNAHRWAAARLLDGWLERGRGYFCSTASAAGLLAQIGSAPYSVTKRAAVAFAEWLSITYGDRGIGVIVPVPAGRQHGDAADVAWRRRRRGQGGRRGARAGRRRRARPPQAIAEERFLVLPHPEVHEYALRKATDIERWLAGMRRLNRRFASSTE